MIAESVKTYVARVHLNKIYLLIKVVFGSVQVPFVNDNCLVKALHVRQNTANSKFTMYCSLHLLMLCT
jgi:hypothetical protein